MSILGENIRKLRISSGLTLQSLSERSGVGKGTISEIENGKVLNPKTETLQKLASALSISIDALTEIEYEHEYMITDIEEAFNIIFSQDNLTLDGNPINDEHKLYIQNTLSLTLNFIKDLNKNTD